MKIAFHKQTKEYTCGPASLQMVLEYFGKDVSQKKLASAMHSSKKVGTAHKELIRAAVNHGLFVYVNNEATLFQIKHFLSLGLPVIVHFVEPSDEESHFAVVIGAKNRTLILHDPWNGKNFAMTERGFVSRWHDEEGRYMHWIMVLSREDFGLGKQYKPKKI